MIEINLLPGVARKAKGRAAALSLTAWAGEARSNLKAPWLVGVVASVAVAAGAVGWMHVTQTARSDELAAREEKALADSARFATVLRQRQKAEAKRDSVQRQLAVIRSIDGDRYIWAHIMDEVSRALPPYTWLKSVAASAPQVAPSGPPVAASPDSEVAPKAPPPPEAPRFRVIGNTVDIQALTRFMKLLETSPFIQNVQLARSDAAIVDGKEVTEFQLDAQYERPVAAVLTSAPVSLSVR